MQGLYWKKIALGLLVPGILGLAISQPVDEDYVSPDHDFMIGTNEQEYEVVPIHKSDIQKRSIDGGFHIKLKAFGEHIKLFLEPQLGALAYTATPVFHVDAKDRITEIPDLMVSVAGTLYTNEKEAATMNIKLTPNGEFLLDGIIGGKGYAIQSTSDPSIETNEVWHQTERFKRFIENTPEHERGNYSYHIVTKLPRKIDQLETYKQLSSVVTRPKRSHVPNVVYPEIMVVVDYSFYKKFKMSDLNTVRYLLGFWNSVDFRYRSLENPKFRLNIAGIIIAKEPKTPSYMQFKCPLYPYHLLIDDALTEKAKFVVKINELFQRTYPFDIVVTMTATVPCKMKKGRCFDGVVGLAYVGGACVLPQLQWYNGRKVSLNIFNSAIVYDNANYAGIHVAAHELGHLFGANHDGEVNKECDEKIGNIMTPTVAHTANSSDWSYCSIKNMEKFLNSYWAQCLFNEPAPGLKVARFLPGKLMPADMQCRNYGQKRAYEHAKDICTRLECLDYQETGVLEYPAAVDGTACGKNKICLHRQCIDLSTITL